MRERSVLASWKQRTLTKFDVDRRSQRQMLYPPHQACTVTRRHHLAAYPCGTSANAAHPVYLGCLGQLTRSPHEGHKVKFTRTIHIGQILTSHPITIRHELKMTKVVLSPHSRKLREIKFAPNMCFCGMCEFTFGATFMYCTRKTITTLYP
jgi:hypothetical protein